MRSTWLSTIAVLLCLGTAAAQPPRFRAGVDLVEVAAVVVDPSDRVVAGLTRDDFELREDGRPVPITTFVGVPGGDGADGTASGASSTENRFVVLLLDDLVSSPVRAATIKRIGRLFADRMGPGDVAAVLRTNGSASTTTSDRAQIVKAIEQFRPDPSDAGRSSDWKRRHVLNTIADLSHQLERVQHQRKALVCIGESSIFAPTEQVARGEQSYGPEWFGALAALGRANVSLYVIDPEGLTHGTTTPFDHVRAFADQSGGAAFVNSNFLERSVDTIWDEAGRYYLLGYQAPAADRKRHTIEVVCRRPGMRVRANTRRF